MNDRRSFYRNYKTIRFAKGETIFLQGQTPKCLYSILSGVVEETSSSSNGEHRSITFDIVGDIFPKCWAFSKTDHTLFHFSAYTDCELYIIDKETFQAQIADNIEFANKMLDRSVNSLLGARLKIDALEKTNTDARLLYLFRYLCLAYSRDENVDTVKIMVPLTQQQLADFAGFTRETASLLLKKLKSQKIVSSFQRYYFVNTKGLSELIDDEYDPGLSVSMLPSGLNKTRFSRKNIL